MSLQSPPRWHLLLLRSFYLLMAVGGAFTFWPGVLQPEAHTGGAHTVVSALLATITGLALLGVWRPLRMLPLLLVELLWKAVWVMAFALPLLRAGQTTPALVENLFACGLGLVLIPLIVPWRWLWRSWRASDGSDA
ncbi:MAG: hypothetical protein J0L58_10865 [Burkholderiales bacterium]|nr:hypothetical protein [Burkholderiales bacterium]